MAGSIDPVELASRLSEKQMDCWLHMESETPLNKYPAKQHARRVATELGVSAGLLILHGEIARNNKYSDMPAPFRQNRYFYYLTGCNETDCHVTYDIEQDSLSLYIPKVDTSRIIWYGRGSTIPEALDKYDVDYVHHNERLQHHTDRYLRDYPGVLYLLDPKECSQIIRPDDKRCDVQSLLPAMNRARVIKDQHEIDLIRKANKISSQAHVEVLANIRKFTNEAQVEGRFLDVCVSNHARKQAYDIIAGSGPNAGTLHYDANNEDFGDRLLMCLDAGCEWQNYASDITRTFPLTGKWTKEGRAIYGLVERMQSYCIEKLRPGVRYLDLHIQAHQIAIEGLLKLGILHNGTPEEIYKAGTSRAFFPHGLGHHIGLEVHDVGHSELMSGLSTAEKEVPSLFPQDYHLSVYDPALCFAPATPRSGPLQEGMVLTVEPGIYFSAYALKLYSKHPVHRKYINVPVLKKYMSVGGVRIEDDILITRDGHENLTTAPKGEAMLRIINGEETPDLDAICSSASSPQRSTVAPQLTEENEEKEESLVPAPGISRSRLCLRCRVYRASHNTDCSEDSHSYEQMKIPIRRSESIGLNFLQRGEGSRR
ncbi:uncharacterized protein EI97DRAFT_433093 [Westerdykella ornata]|uniref:Xaa-Pro aminopeptidase n=1 Tax=Westerdykella ornata TaxID=318751 RepID=A0A6A6JL73_WESOR|nr:uncharacterized protein EI97DRAFT_433093 [Westerdykella ornata]KAF2276863.1 hypothetical protein EI97DRAFT_433093 [Westerdykella ornata]